MPLGYAHCTGAFSDEMRMLLIPLQVIAEIARLHAPEMSHPVKHHVRVVPIGEGDEQGVIPGDLHEGAPRRSSALHTGFDTVSAGRAVRLMQGSRLKMYSHTGYYPTK